MASHKIMKQIQLMKSEARDTLSRELKMWRLRQGLSQQQVAKMFGTSKWSILRAEHDAYEISEETSYKIWAKLAQELRREGYVEPEDNEL